MDLRANLISKASKDLEAEMAAEVLEPDPPPEGQKKAVAENLVPGNEPPGGDGGETVAPA
jgi:hypothetical protein